MIDAAISLIAGQLNEFLKRTFDLDEDAVVISNLLEQDGSVATHTNNKLVLFVVNIERESLPFRSSNSVPVGAERVVVSNPPVFLNLYLMVASNFPGKNYLEALKFLSNAIRFFQARASFDHRNTPDLDPGIEKLTLEIENLNVQDLSTLWGALSGKYLPSVLYKLRMVALDTGDVLGQLDTIRDTRPKVRS
jgi:hypothetical protein